MITKKKLDSIIETQANLNEAAFELCRRLARGEDVPTTQYAVFDSLGWDTRRINGEVARTEAALNWAESAGTDDEIATAKAEYKAVSDASEKELDDITMKLRELQDRQSEITKAVDAKRQVFAKMEEARAHVRKLAPKHVMEQYEREVHELRQSSLGQHLHCCEQEYRDLKYFCSLRISDLSTQEKEGIAKRFGEEYQGMTSRAPSRPQVIRRLHDGTTEHRTQLGPKRYIDSVYEKWQTDMRNALPEAEAKYNEAKAEFDKAKAALGKMLDYWMQ